MITLLSATACLSGMTGSLLLSLGKLRAGYRAGIVTGLSYAALNLLLSVNNPGVMILVIPSAWGVITSYHGLRRIRERGGAAPERTEPCRKAP